MSNKIKQVLSFAFVVFSFPFLLLFLKNEFLVALALIIIVLVTFKIHYENNEFKLFIIGTLAGFVIEVGGDLIYKLQSWDQGSLFGLPVWLPIFWGYAFVVIRRVGNLITEKK